jgi:hypothetical protein
MLLIGNILSAQHVVRIATELLSPIDNAVKTAKDEFGVKRFKSRKDVVDEAVRRFLRELRKEVNQ